MASNRTERNGRYQNSPFSRLYLLTSNIIYHLILDCTCSYAYGSHVWRYINGRLHSQAYNCCFQRSVIITVPATVPEKFLGQGASTEKPNQHKGSQLQSLLSFASVPLLSTEDHSLSHMLTLSV